MGIITFILAAPILRMFSQDADVVREGVAAIRVVL